jgi:hypothetical protein
MRELHQRGFDWTNILSGKSGPADFESAISQEMLRATGMVAGDRAPCHGYQSGRYPIEVLDERFCRDSSDYIVGSTSSGAGLVEAEVLDQDPVLPLRPVSVLLNAGANVIETTKNNLSIPRIYSPPPASSGETQSVSVIGSNGFTSEQLQLQAVNYVGGFGVSNQVLQQASDRKIREFIVSLIRTSVGKLIDNLSINGNGSTNGTGQKLQALGLNNYPVNSAGQYDPGSLVPSTSFSSPPTVNNVAQAVYNLDSANFEESFENRVWLLPPSVKQTLATTPAISGQSAQYLYDYRSGRVGNYRALTSNQLTASGNSFLIDSREAVFLLVGGFQLTVDHITYASSFQTLFVVGILSDFGMLRGGACLVS